MREIKLQIPWNLDVDEIIRNDRYGYFTTYMEKDRLIYICDALYNARMLQRKEMYENNNSYTNLCSQYLDKVVYNYNSYLDFLIKAGVIECDNHFIVGEKCRGYRFKAPYSGQPPTEMIVTNYCLKKAIRRERERWNDIRQKDMHGYSYFIKWWDSKKLEIDVKAAYNWIDEDTEIKIAERIKDASILNKDDAINDARDTNYDFKRLVSKIDSDYYDYSFSGVGHRFYSPITNLKKGLRKFLTFDGQQLVSIDIKNSQPFLSIALFKREFWENLRYKDGGILRLKDIESKMYKEIRRSKEYYNINTLLVSSKDLTNTGSPYKKYIDLVITGNLYEWIQEMFEPLHLNRFDSRDKVKVEVLRIMYLNANKVTLPRYSPSLTFASHFGQVYQLFQSIKLVKQNYLPLILQRIESYLVIDIICKKISETNPEIPLFTIHDSIITTIGNEALVEAIIGQEIENYIGYKPQLEIECLSGKQHIPVS